MALGFDILTWMEVMAFIPARFGSTRLEGKPLKMIGDKPMIQRVYERTLAAACVNEVTVATDDERVVRCVEGFGGSVVMTSPDHKTGTERIAEAASDVRARIVVNVQGDEPLILPEMIDAAVRPLLADPSLEASTLKTSLKEPGEISDPNVVKVVTDASGFALYFSRSPIPRLAGGTGPYFKHIGLYVYTKEFLLKLASTAPTVLETAEGLEQLRILESGHRIMVVETRHNPCSVDTPEDLAIVRRIVKDLEVK